MIEHDIWVQTGAGIAFDLINPTPEMVDIKVDIAEALARTPRFGGHIRSGAYSVAQHSVIGADVLFQETGDTELAAAFLLHDAHKAYIGDITTPVAKAIARYAGSFALTRPGMSALPADWLREYGRRMAQGGLEALKHAIDARIHEAAGIRFPHPPAIATAIKTMDLRMLATERTDLLGPSPQPWPAHMEAAEPIRRKGRLIIWSWPRAAEEFIGRLERFCPQTLLTREAP